MKVGKPYADFDLFLWYFASLCRIPIIFIWKTNAGMDRQLQELSPQSNQRLTCFVIDKATKALCLEMNNYIDAQQKAVLKSQEAERELKYTIACVSHDIRTP